MLPELATTGAVASSTPMPAPMLSPDSRVTSPGVDWERGGTALQNAAQGHDVKDWRCWVDGHRVMVQAGLDAPVALFAAGGISEVSLAFDQAMRYCVAYVQNGVARLRWFDTLAGEHIITDLPGARCPRVTLDDKRGSQIASCDIVLAYLRGDTLYCRQQRDRFETEYTVRAGLYPNAVLRNVGMNRQWRLQFDLAMATTPG